MQLQFKREFAEIKNSINETKRVVRMRSSQATIEDLTKILGQQPMAFHFSGHGILNTEKNFGRKHYMLKKDEGNYLLFEKVDGEGELVSEKTLKELILYSNINLEFVFVASCHSQFAGQIFLNAGAKHVICIRQESQVLDEAVITFSKAFYHSVFSQNMTICDSFALAQKQVQAKFNQSESNKFMLLKQEKQGSASQISNDGAMDMDDIDYLEELLAMEEGGSAGATKAEEH